MLTTIRYVLLTAFRDKLFFGLLLFVLAATFVSAALGGTSIVEEQQMTIVFAAGASRLIVMTGLIVFICFHIRSAFDSREIDVMVTRPISRGRLVLAHWLGFAAVASCLALPTALVIAALKPMHWDGWLIWASSLWLETLLVSAIALFAALMLKSAVSAVMTTLGFYVLSRMMAFFVATTHSTLVFRTVWVNDVARLLMDAISTIVPRLDFFGKTVWMVYGTDDAYLDVPRFLIQSAVFIPLLLVVAVIDFRRRQF